MRSLLQTTTAVLGWAVAANAYDLTVNDKKSVESAAAKAAKGLTSWYTGMNPGDTPGNLPDPYYWWEAGAMFGTLVDYWWLTGDDKYNTITKQAMIHQAGDGGDYMPDNQTMTEGNDDQGFWAMAAMSAAEHQFPDPPDETPGWLAQAQAVFNEYVSRWDPEYCGGGMRWQIFKWNTGYDYKNAISNGCFFNIASRLALYTGNQTYADWAEKVWDWHTKAGVVTDKFEVLDGVHIGKSKSEKCDDIDKTQWSYNTGIFLHGAATLYNLTSDDKWKKRTDGLLDDVFNKFVKDEIIYEQFCEPHKQCSQDQQSFKGYLARWLAATTQLYPGTKDKIMKLLKTSAQAAAKVCSGSGEGYKGPSGTACGFSWTTGSFDGSIGVGPQMNALSIFMYTLVESAKGPVTSKTGGTSKGNPNGGNTEIDASDNKPKMKEITTSDKAGAGILTFLFVAGVIGGVSFLVVDM
ncbi:mannan endo-1 [Fusarium chlamydosporum]